MRSGQSEVWSKSSGDVAGVLGRFLEAQVDDDGDAGRHALQGTSALFRR